MNYYNRSYRKIFGILVPALVFLGFVIFAKAAPTVTVTAPNGGEVLTTSKIYRITWNSENVDKVSIGYSFGEGSLNWIATNSDKYCKHKLLRLDSKFREYN
ncbi:hypothetical protein HYS99_01790 [Candidatus Giovannonibacteria bacterium]|nr:hypothetical protein [Candidatus Giovannonibacteria bacterium]